MERHFDDELKELQDRLLYMGGLVEKMIGFALKGLEEKDEEVLQQVFAFEREINHLHIEVDDRCLRLLALRQPIAVDLRLITSVMKINNDLERMGDQAVNISENTQKFLQQKTSNPVKEMRLMGEIVTHMVQTALEAFVNRDEILAKQVIERDDEVDQFKSSIFDEMLKKTTAQPKRVQSFLELILISRNLERIADHATNIAEGVIFMVSAIDVRHHIVAEELEEK